MATLPFWANFLAQQGSQSDEGLWPTEKPHYDPNNFCQLQGPSKDSFDAGGNPVVVRTSSSEGMWETQEECCQALWCQNRCDAFAQSPCDKGARYSCESRCAPSPDAPPSSPPSGHHGHHKSHHKHNCLTQKGVQYCGEDCAQAGKDGFGCWDEKNCQQVSPDDAVRGRRYFPDMARCCVEYAALNGGDTDTAKRCAQDPTSQRRVTDYPKGEPAKDRGEFPPASPQPAPSPRAKASHAPRPPSPRRSPHRPRDRHSHARPSHDRHPVAPHGKTVQLKLGHEVPPAR
jgi:hypothetical protein